MMAFFFFFFGVPNAKTSAFGTPDASAFIGRAHMLFFQINIHYIQVTIYLLTNLGCTCKIRASHYKN